MLTTQLYFSFLRRIIRLKLKHNSPGINLMRLSGDDDHVTCCGTTSDCGTIILGTKCGRMQVHRCNVMSSKVALIIICNIA